MKMVSIERKALGLQGILLDGNKQNMWIEEKKRRSSSKVLCVYTIDCDIGLFVLQVQITFVLVNSVSNDSQLLTTPDKKPFESIVGKEKKNVVKQHFLLFPQCFQPY